MKRWDKISMVVLMMMLLACAGCGRDEGTQEGSPSVAAEAAGARTESFSAPPEAAKEDPREADYTAAVESFEAGSSHSVYYDLAALEGYKDSAQLMQEAKLQNWLNFFAHGLADRFYEARADYPLLSEDEIFQAVCGKEWLVPNIQAEGYMEYDFHTDGTGKIIHMNGRSDDITWEIRNGDVAWRYPDSPEDVPGNYDLGQEFRKIADGVYMVFFTDAEEMKSGSSAVAYIERDSDWGARYARGTEILMDLSAGASGHWRVVEDDNGLYYAHVED